MTDTSSSTFAPPSAEHDRAGSGSPGSAVERSGGGDSELVTDRGRTVVADPVVAKIAGVAAQEIDGVHAMGGTGARVIGAVKDRLGGASQNQGVSVEVGERQAAIDLTLVVEYGVSITDLAQGVRDNVIDRVETMTGLEVKEVNIDVTDVFIAGSDQDQDDRPPPPPRVQ
jgi:uncharacterized alkaline shock family protein YloU